MEQLEQLFLYFRKYVPLSAAETEALAAGCRIRSIKRRYFLLQEGDVCTQYTFVLEGCLKMYYVDHKGTEHNLQFAAENNWIADLGSFHAKAPSKLYIEAMEPSTVVQISYSNLITLYTDHPKFNRNFRVITEEHFIEQQQRLLQTISSTAQERYAYFLERYPELSTRLPNTQIASYIGITPEFLSKIRKEAARGNKNS